MALSHVASSAWVSSGTTVTPTLPTGTVSGDLVVITLVSKYDDASLGGDPAGWTSLGGVSNTGRSAGNDNGNLRGRAFYRIYDGAWSMPTLSPTPNNVSTVKASTYRVAAGMTYGLSGELVADNTTGTPLLLAATSTLGLAVGDFLHWDVVVNGDAPTWGTSTVSATGLTFSANNTTTADASTATGTDLRMRAAYNSVTAGTASGNPQVSTALAGTTTNAVGVGLLLRIREITPPDVTVVADALSAGPTTLFPPGVTTQTSIDASLLAAPAALHAPMAVPGVRTVGADFLTAPAAALPPAGVLRGAVAVAAPVLTTAAVLYAPGGWYHVAAPLLAAPSAVHPPPMMWLAVDVTVVVPHIYV